MKQISTLLICLSIVSVSFSQEVVFDSFPVSPSIFPASFQFKNYYGFFYGLEDWQDKIWLTDGTAENTRQVGLAFNTNYYEVNKNFIFYINRPERTIDYWNLYATDGDTTMLIRGDIRSNSGLVTTDTLAFFFDDGQVWRTNGYPNGTFQLTPFINLNAEFIPYAEENLLYFYANDKMYVTDGSVAGTQLYFEPDSNLTSIRGGIDFNGIRIYQACTATEGCELWRSDGTPTGTYMIADLTPDFYNNGSPISSYPGSFKVINNKVFFKLYLLKTPQLLKNKIIVAKKVCKRYLCHFTN